MNCKDTKKQKQQNIIVYFTAFLFVILRLILCLEKRMNQHRTHKSK